jgi:hypothetical protein
MTLVDFVEKYNGKKVDFDKRYGPQCVDLYRQYCQDVLNTPHTGGVNGAVDIYKNYFSLPLENKYFERLDNTPQFLPNAGDVVVFDATPNNRFGHVAVVLFATKKTMIIFEQDGYKQDGAKITEHTYSYCLGFLRRRV